MSLQTGFYCVTYRTDLTEFMNALNLNGAYISQLAQAYCNFYTALIMH